MCCRTPFGCRPGSSPPPMFHCVALVAWQPLQRLWSKASCNAAQSVSSPRWWWDTGQWRPKPRKPQCSPAWCGACMRCSVYSPWCRPPAKREKPEKKGENDTWPICTSVPLGFHPCLKSRFILLSAHHWRGSGKGVTIKQTWQHPSFFPEWRWERSGDWGGEVSQISAASSPRSACWLPHCPWRSSPQTAIRPPLDCCFCSSDRLEGPLLPVESSRPAARRCPLDPAALPPAPCCHVKWRQGSQVCQGRLNMPFVRSALLHKPYIRLRRQKRPLHHPDLHETRLRRTSENPS